MPSARPGAWPACTPTCTTACTPRSTVPCLAPDWSCSGYAKLRIAGATPYLSRIERGRERPPKPELVKRMATLLGCDPDLLFRLAERTDPDLAEYIHLTPKIPEFLRTARDMNLTSEGFDVLIKEVKQRRPSETVTADESQVRQVSPTRSPKMHPSTGATRSGVPAAGRARKSVGAAGLR